MQESANGAEQGSCGDAGAALCPASAPQNGQACDADAAASCAYPLPPTGTCRAWVCSCIPVAAVLGSAGPSAWVCNEDSCVLDSGANPCVDAGVVQGFPCAEEGLLCNSGGVDPTFPSTCLCSGGRWACVYDGGP